MKIIIKGNLAKLILLPCLRVDHRVDRMANMNIKHELVVYITVALRQHATFTVNHFVELSYNKSSNTKIGF